MSIKMTETDFDQAAKGVVEKEFNTLQEVGLLTDEVLCPIAQRMCESIHKVSPTMSGLEAEYLLQLLRKECRKMADKILKMAEDTCWKGWRKNTKSMEEPISTEDAYLLF